VVIVDVSVKNNTITTVSYALSKYRDIIRIVHHVFNVMTTEAELFTIRSGINQACQISDVKKVHVITNSIYTAKYIFDSSTYLLLQIRYSLVVILELNSVSEVQYKGIMTDR